MSAAGAAHTEPSPGGGKHGHVHAPGAGASKLDVAKTNLAYLALGNKAGIKPGSVATRGFLTTTRYVIRYAIRRLLRVAKYAVIGAGIAFIGTGLLGTLGTGLAWFAVPSTGMGIGMGITWGLIKFGWRHRPERLRGGWWSEMSHRANEGRDPANDEAADAEVADAAAKEDERRRMARAEAIWVGA